MYDIAIIGAGPAGSTLARLLAERYKILLVDKRPLDENPEEHCPDKCCGGLLAPDAQAMLSKMGLGLPKNVLVGPQLFVVRAIDVRHRLERYYQRYYINMDRGKFDRWLLSMIAPSVEMRLGLRFKSYRRDKNHFTIKLVKDGNINEEHARILVGADGASSRVRKLALPNSVFPKCYIAIQQWFEAEKQLPYFSTLFDPEITDYYCWTIPKQEHLIIGAALSPGPEVTDKFELLKSRLTDCGFRFGKLVRREASSFAPCCHDRFPRWPMVLPSSARPGVSSVRVQPRELAMHLRAPWRWRTCCLRSPMISRDVTNEKPSA